MLIDGAIVNSGTLGSYDFANLTTDNIERVEILRGAQSMLWGSDAMGGVINVVTKRGQGPFPPAAFWNMAPSLPFAKAARSPENRAWSTTVSRSPAGIPLVFRL